MNNPNAQKSKMSKHGKKPVKIGGTMNVNTLLERGKESLYNG